MNKDEATWANEAVATVVVNAIKFRGFDRVTLAGEGAEHALTMDLTTFARWLKEACAAVDEHIGLVEA